MTIWLKVIFKCTNNNKKWQKCSILLNNLLVIVSNAGGRLMNVEKNEVVAPQGGDEETINLVGILSGSHRRPRGCQTDEWPEKIGGEDNKTTEP